MWWSSKGREEPKFYRLWIRQEDLLSFTIRIKESDLFVRAERNIRKKALRILQKHRGALERYIERHPNFLTSLKPLPLPTDAPEIVRRMIEASQRADVGPMAAVAGAIAELVGEELMPYSRELIIENAGDIFLASSKKRIVGIFAGDSPLSGRIGLEIEPHHTPLGICTSAGTVGHSLSFGRADAVVVLAPSAALADAAATALGNMIGSPADIPRALKHAEEIGDLKGVVIIKGDKLGAWGEVKLISL